MLQNGIGLLGGFFLIFYIIMMFGMVIGYVIIIMALWRGMKAHESIAETLKNYFGTRSRNSFDSD